MGKPMLPETLRALVGHAAPSPLLAHLAGEHAPGIAAAWPAPHVDFLALPAARRHAAAMLLERNAAREQSGVDHVVRVIERARDFEVAVEIMGYDPPAGLMKALGRCGETLWTAQDYGLLRRMFSAESNARVLRHMRDLRPEAIARIDLLPDALRTANIVARLPDSTAAIEDFVSAWHLALRIHGAGEAPRLLARWDRAETTLKLFDMAAEALYPSAFGRILARPDLGPAFTRVDDRKSLEAVALEFKNCLRNYASAQAMGRLCVFVRRAVDEPIVFALCVDAAGWRLAEAKLKGNDEVRDEALKALIAELAAAGVRTGEAVDKLRTRLHEHVCSNCGPAYVPQRETWRQRLALGDYHD